MVWVTSPMFLEQHDQNNMLRPFCVHIIFAFTNYRRRKLGYGRSNGALRQCKEVARPTTFRFHKESYIETMLHVVKSFQ